MTTTQDLLNDIEQVGRQSRAANQRAMDDHVGSLAAASLLMTNTLTMHGMLHPSMEAEAEVGEDVATKNPQ